MNNYQSSWIPKVVISIFIITAILIVGRIILYGFITIKVIENPEAIAEGTGKLIKIFKDSAGF